MSSKQLGIKENKNKKCPRAVATREDTGNEPSAPCRHRGQGQLPAGTEVKASLPTRNKDKPSSAPGLLLTRKQRPASFPTHLAGGGVTPQPWPPAPAALGHGPVVQSEHARPERPLSQD